MVKQSFYIFLLVLALCLSCLLGMPAQYSGLKLKPAEISGDVGEYSDVLSDLRLDSNFNSNEYESNYIDYSLNVITVAKSINDKLFVYVYQPAGGRNNTVATSINISESEHSTEKSFINYKLSLVSHSDVFMKYVVLDLEVGENFSYEISSIFRKWNSSDKNASGGNSISEVAYPVGKLYQFNNGLLTVNDMDYITITDKYVGFVRYYGGSYVLVRKNCDSHFVAFSTDRRIDRLLEADVYFRTQRLETHTNFILSDRWLDEEPVEEYRYLTEEDEASYNGDGFWKHNYRWDRIQTVDEFLSGEDFDNVYQGAIIKEKVTYKMTEESKENLKTKQWVLRFYESEYKYTFYPGNGATSDSEEIRTNVTDVSILRLKFETDGVVYNLGVVDNKQTGKETPDNTVEVKTELSENFTGMIKKILGIVLLVLIIALCGPFIPIVISVVVMALKAVIGIVSGIFKGIGKLFKRSKQE